MVRGLSLSRRRPPPGATLVLSMPHPAQRDFDAALTTIGRAAKHILVRPEGTLRGVPTERISTLAAKAQRARQHLVLHATLLPDAKLVPLFDRTLSQVEAALAALGGGVRVVLLWTPQDRLVEVTYVKQAENGAQLPFAEHLARAMAADLAYAPFVRNLQSLSDIAALTCTSWAAADERLSAVLTSVLDPLGVRRTLVRDFDRPAIVRGYASQQGVQVAQAMHAFVDTPEERALVRSFVREHFRARTVQDMRYLTAEDRARLVERYAADVAAFGGARSQAVSR